MSRKYNAAACIYYTCTVFQILSDEHVDANAVSQEGKTALHYTVRNGDTDTPRTYLFLDNVGLDPNFGDAGG